ncbi:prepilin peptidase [Candidatus Woesearchaeota archaeon]|jgi:Flp pilus assembly protein protease CpaA|nr:prepilin peptidase [Candidatus Woesearchaeota archaeon]
MNTIIFTIGLIALLIGSFTDLKKREVPDWVNFGLMFIGIGVSLLFSIISGNYFIILGSIIGLTLMYALGSLMFYTGQWGGGDSKMLMGLGALIGIPLFLPIKNIFMFWKADLPFLFIFVIYIMVTGAFYGLLWSIGLAIIHRKTFVKDIVERLNTKKAKLIKYVLFGLSIVAVIILFLVDNLIFKLFPIWLTVLLVLLFYMYYFIKSIEKCCMIKLVEPEELTEGEWINKDIYIDLKKGKAKIGKKTDKEVTKKLKAAKNVNTEEKARKEYICGPKDLGISKEQIATLLKLKKSKIYTKKIEIKIGIPFVPSFLIAYLISYFVGIGWIVVLLS